MVDIYGGKSLFAKQSCQLIAVLANKKKHYQLFTTGFDKHNF